MPLFLLVYNQSHFYIRNLFSWRKHSTHLLKADKYERHCGRLPLAHIYFFLLRSEWLFMAAWEKKNAQKLNTSMNTVYIHNQLVFPCISDSHRVSFKNKYCSRFPVMGKLCSDLKAMSTPPYTPPHTHTHTQAHSTKVTKRN